MDGRDTTVVAIPGEDFPAAATIAADSEAEVLIAASMDRASAETVASTVVDSKAEAGFMVAKAFTGALPTAVVVSMVEADSMVAGVTKGLW
jgi:type II secretory pathway component PulK